MTAPYLQELKFFLFLQSLGQSRQLNRLNNKEFEFQKHPDAFAQGS